MLMPAALLVLFVLAAITFDYAHLYLARQELVTAAEAAANDAATVDPAQADVVVADALAGRDDLHLVAPPVVEVLSPTSVRVTLVADVRYVFAPAIPGAPHDATVRVTATSSGEG
jgi:hypothetical protein